MTPIKLEWLEHLPTHPELSDGAVRTAVRLAAYADKTGTDAFPGPARLARDTGQGLRTVKRHLDALTAAGVVCKVKVGGSRDGRREASEYALVEWWTRASADTGTDHTRATADTGTRATTDTGPVVVVAHHPGNTPDNTPSSTPEREDQSMDDATWLAAELDADPAGCRAAIEWKQRQAADRGNPWRNLTRMVRDVIPLDEWRPLVQQHAPKPRRPTLAQCGSTQPHGAHKWENRRNLFHCMGETP